MLPSKQIINLDLNLYRRIWPGFRPKIQVIFESNFCLYPTGHQIILSSICVYKKNTQYSFGILSIKGIYSDTNILRAHFDIPLYTQITEKILAINSDTKILRTSVRQNAVRTSLDYPGLFTSFCGNYAR